jgi:hypothetical protein
MRRTRRWLAVSAPLGFALALVLSMGLSDVTLVLAQDGTPTPVTFPISPDAVGCTVEERPISDFERLLPSTPQADPAAPAASPTRFVIPGGVPADATTVSGVTTTLLELYACYHAGDPRRFHALFTDEGLQRAFPPGMITPEFIDEFFAASPVPLEDPEQRATILAIEGVTLLADGRVGTMVRSDEPEFGGLWTVYWIFVEAGDRFLVDDVIHDVSAEGSTPEASTPAP